MISSRLATTPPVTQPPQGFIPLEQSHRTHPLASLCASFWGQTEKLDRIRPGNVIEITCEPLESTDSRFYFFEQYRYMQQRIDAVRLMDDLKPQRRERRSVVVVGTGGIGKGRSTYYHYLTVPSR